MSLSTKILQNQDSHVDLIYQVLTHLNHYLSGFVLQNPENHQANIKSLYELLPFLSDTYRIPLQRMIARFPQAKAASKTRIYHEIQLLLNQYIWREHLNVRHCTKDRFLEELQTHEFFRLRDPHRFIDDTLPRVEIKLKNLPLWMETGFRVKWHLLAINTLVKKDFPDAIEVEFFETYTNSDQLFIYYLPWTPRMSTEIRRAVQFQTITPSTSKISMLFPFDPAFYEYFVCIRNLVREIFMAHIVDYFHQNPPKTKNSSNESPPRPNIAIDTVLLRKGAPKIDLPREYFNLCNNSLIYATYWDTEALDKKMNVELPNSNFHIFL